MRAALLLCAVAAFAQQSDTADDLLASARAKLTKVTAAAPKYTCTQTVDRSFYRETRQVARSCDTIVANRRNGRSKLTLTATDRLRLEVEVADAGFEIFAWPGATRIETGKLEDFGRGGPLGTGPFGPFLVDVFSNHSAEFQFLRQAAGLFEYRYRVPLAASHYQVQAGARFRTTPYDGTFRLDPGTAELKQLTVRTGELAADTASCEATTIMDFEPLRIGAGDYVLPRQTRLQVIGRDAGFTENTTVYSDCREFRGESVVRFDAPAPPAGVPASARAPAQAPSLPPAMPVVLILDAEIDTDRAAAGDPVWARIGKPLVDPATRQVLAPAGSLVHGRITQLEHHVDGDKYFLVGLTFDTLEVSGSTAPLAVILNSVHQIQRQGPRGGVTTTESHSALQGGGTLVFPTAQTRYVVPRGYTSNWLTY